MVSDKTEDNQNLTDGYKEAVQPVTMVQFFAALCHGSMQKRIFPLYAAAAGGDHRSLLHCPADCASDRDKKAVLL